MIDENSPSWYTNEILKFFSTTYLYNCKTPKEQYHRLASTVAKHFPEFPGIADQLFNLMWDGILSPSTPALANGGTKRGHVVACSGGTVPDSLLGFANTYKECMLLTKAGKGTAYYGGDVRPRGSSISVGGKADGAGPVFENLRRICQQVSQGSTRRGAVAFYYPISGGDFWEIFNFVKRNPDDSNIGWCVDDTDIERLVDRNPDVAERINAVIWLRVTLGRGYIFFTDKVNRARPQALKDRKLWVPSSNLCTEITLPSNDEYTFSCVLASINLMHWDKIKNSNATELATLFCDGLASEFIAQAKGKEGFEKIIRFTEDFRALGLGVLGLHSLFQYRGLPFGSLDAHYLNSEIFKTIQRDSEIASHDLAYRYGEPKIMEGTGLRNSHRTAMMPTMSTSILMGGYSEGINPVTMNVMLKDGAAGELDYVNPWFAELLDSKGLGEDRNREIVRRVGENDGSMLGIPEFTAEELEIGKTAFEIRQEDILRLASQRQRYICQAQSLNLFFSQNENPKYIAQIHKMAFLDEYIHTLYYTRSSMKTGAHNVVACENCAS